MPLPIITVAQMREWENATWASGQTEAEVIRRVGERLAGCALRLTRSGDRIVVLAGNGHNGDDARAAVPNIRDRRTQLLSVMDPGVDIGLLRDALKTHPPLVIDALFGIGLNRPLSPAWVAYIETLNEYGPTVLAVDVPSGLNAETGGHYAAVVRADLTLTVGAPKVGLLAPAALPWVGRLEVASDVGLLESWLAGTVPGAQCLWPLAQDLRGFPPRRKSETHKGTFGHLGIVAGSPGFHGAAVLAARGAQRAQPGLITLYATDQVYSPICAHLQAVMVSPWQTPPKLPGPHDAVLIGPGLAAPELRDSMSALTRHLWRDAECPLVVDASALDWVPLEAPARNAIRVLTPHPGEAARLLRSTASQVQADRVGALRGISKRYGNSWIVLKGNHSLIGRSTGEIYVNPTGNPYLAQGGSGDLLAGFIAGLLAQPELRTRVPELLQYATRQHGAAADRLQLSRHNWIVEDLAAELGATSVEE